MLDIGGKKSGLGSVRPWSEIDRARAQKNVCPQLPNPHPLYLVPMTSYSQSKTTRLLLDAPYACEREFPISLSLSHMCTCKLFYFNSFSSCYLNVTLFFSTRIPNIIDSLIEIFIYYTECPIKIYTIWKSQNCP